MSLQVITRTNGTRRVQRVPEGETKVEQSHKKSCDINDIMRRYQKTGLFPQRTDRPKYGNFIGTGDLHEAMNRVKEAQVEFLMLPSDIRSRFQNDPGLLLEFIGNEANREEAENLGLLPRVESPPPENVAPEGSGAPPAGSGEPVATE